MQSETQIPIGPHGAILASEVVVVDTETTGLAPHGLNDDGGPTGDPDGPDRLCSIALIILRREGAAWHVRGNSSWLLDPERPIPEAAARVNGFAWSGPRGPGQSRLPVPETRTDLYRSLKFRAVAPEILRHINGRPLVAHNANFDVAVIDAELERAGFPILGNLTICTKKAFSEIQGLGRPDHYVPGTNLNKLCDRLGVDRSSRLDESGHELHGAIVDAELASRCFTSLDRLGWLLAEPAASLPHRRTRLAQQPEPVAPSLI